VAVACPVKSVSVAVLSQGVGELQCWPFWREFGEIRMKSAGLGRTSADFGVKRNRESCVKKLKLGNTKTRKHENSETRKLGNGIVNCVKLLLREIGNLAETNRETLSVKLELLQLLPKNREPQNFGELFAEKSLKIKSEQFAPIRCSFGNFALISATLR
jgi:hypothetical protein